MLISISVFNEYVNKARRKHTEAVLEGSIVIINPYVEISRKAQNNSEVSIQDHHTWKMTVPSGLSWDLWDAIKQIFKN